MIDPPPPADTSSFAFATRGLPHRPQSTYFRRHPSDMTTIEDVRTCPAKSGKAPPRPEAFDSRYKLPCHRVKLLERKNGHWRDSRVVFYEEPHIYTIDGHVVQESVSGLSRDFKRQFVPEEAIASMKRSRREQWPRLAYVSNAHPVEMQDLCTPSLAVDADTNITVAAHIDPGLNGARALEALWRFGTRNRNNLCFYNFDRVMHDSEISEAWDANAEDARNRGTEAHLQMELWFNSEPARLEDDEVRMGLDFVRRCLLPIGAKAYRTEWTIFAEEENVAGCIDLAVELPSGQLFLVDWKRSKKLQQQMYGFASMKEPFGHLDDCGGCAYALQLSCYQYILEKYYNKRVLGRVVASIHPDHPFETPTPYMKEETEYLMARCRAATDARASLVSDESNRQFICSLSGRIVMTAVRDAETGALYDEKTARVEQKRVVVDASTTALVTDLVKRSSSAVTPMSGQVEWKVLFSTVTDNMKFYS